MGRAKIKRGSTNIDMTAMCDVAFLLLSFFILATKPIPHESCSNCGVYNPLPGILVVVFDPNILHINKIKCFH